MDAKQEYEHGRSEHERWTRFMMQPRCVECDEYRAGDCARFGLIPEDYRYQVNDCPHWMYQVPF